MTVRHEQISWDRLNFFSPPWQLQRQQYGCLLPASSVEAEEAGSHLEKEDRERCFLRLL